MHVHSKDNGYNRGTAYLKHVLLDAVHLTRTKNCQQLIIRDEEEAWEGISLRLEVVCQGLLTCLEAGADGLQFCGTTGLETTGANVWVLGCILHGLGKMSLGIT